MAGIILLFFVLFASLVAVVFALISTIKLIRRALKEVVVTEIGQSAFASPAVDLYVVPKATTVSVFVEPTVASLEGASDLSAVDKKAPAEVSAKAPEPEVPAAESAADASARAEPEISRVTAAEPTPPGVSQTDLDSTGELLEIEQALERYVKDRSRPTTVSTETTPDEEPAESTEFEAEPRIEDTMLSSELRGIIESIMTDDVAREAKAAALEKPAQSPIATEKPEAFAEPEVEIAPKGEPLAEPKKQAEYVREKLVEPIESGKPAEIQPTKKPLTTKVTPAKPIDSKKKKAADVLKAAAKKDLAKKLKKKLK